VPDSVETGYRLHSRIRLIALVITVTLVAVEVFLATRLPDLPYSGITLNNTTVARVAEGSAGAQAGLKKGDRILGADGKSCTSLKDVSECLARAGPGEQVTFEVLRRGEVLRLPVTLWRLPTSEILRKIMLLAVGFSFIAIGLVVYFRRADKLALVFYLLCFTFGLVLANTVTFDLVTARHAARSILNDLLVLALPALFLHFFLLFPQKGPVLRKHPRLEWFLYLPLLCLYPVSVFFNVMLFTYGRSFAQALAVFDGALALYFIACFVGGLVSFFTGYRRVRSRTVRGKLRLVVWGTLAGVLPIVTVYFILSVKPSLEIPGERLVFLPLVLVPIAFGHAIVRYGLLDLKIVVRSSLVYTLLTAVLASVYFLVVYGIGRLVSRVTGSTDLLFSIVSIFVITLLISPLRDRIKNIVDRAFFREEYSYRRALKQISHSLAGIIHLEDLVSYLCIRISQVLDARSAMVFLYDDRHALFTARYGVGIDHTMVRAFDPAGTLADFLQSHRVALNLERRIAANRPLPISPVELRTLLRAGISLVVPFVFKSELLGFIAFGSKRSDDFYSGHDVELLETLADHAAVAIQNARLYVENVEKQKMEQELEVAREIQHRLMPKAFPGIPGIRTQAVNVPSKPVGGDYYDVIDLGHDRVAVVIADVSGKGVPAALLMASLQSSLRAEATANALPSRVISRLNRVILENTLGSAFVTVFYGIIDFEQRTLTYSNAGHPPPIITGRDGTVKLLDQTDLVIGIEAETAYRDTVVSLREGDLVFLYTDGITDELNDRDECYGETRLLNHLRVIHRLSLSEIMERVHRSVLEHTGGELQDDLTALAILLDTLAPYRDRTASTRKRSSAA
jgi:sigma-B regulation protein RsbU (phosphoserine phosphatase)